MYELKILTMLVHSEGIYRVKEPVVMFVYGCVLF